ncbi:MAG: ABC transporter permease [Sphingomonas sp.]
MLLRYLTVEILKLRNSLALLLCLAAPACIAILGSLIVLDRGGNWQTFVLGNAAFWAFAMLPLTLTALSVLLAQMEHGAKAWDHVLALPGARRNVYLAKALVMLALLAGMSVWLWVLLHATGFAIEAIAPGKLRGSPQPGAAARILAEMAFASLLVAVLQLWVALRFRSFVPPLVFGIAGTFAALVAVGARQGLYFPWLMAVNVMGGDPGRHSTALLLGGGGGLAMLAAMCVMLARRDMVS